jgi:hypothetical protein
MQRRKYLAALGSLAAGGAAIGGTGAFTQVSANRGVSVNLANDNNAYLALKSSSNRNRNDEYVVYENDGTLSIDMTSNNPNLQGNGINDDAVTIIRDMFDIVNQGPNPVFVWHETNANDGDSDANDGNGAAPFGLFSDFPANKEPGAGPRQSGPGGVTTGLGEGEKAQDALSSEEGNNLGSSIPARNVVRPGQTMREVGTFFFGIDPNDFPINGDITIVAQDVNTFEGTVDFSVGGPREVEVTDPTP